MPVQKRIAQVSVAKQSAKGSAASVGTFQVGVVSGQVVGADVDEAELPVTWSSRTPEGWDRIAVVPGMEFTVVAYPKSIGLLIYAACGAVVDSGSGNFTHTITTGTDLPYLTLFATYGGEFYKIVDSKIDTLELTWDRTGALQGKVKFVGCDLTFPVSADTPTNTERPKDGLLKGTGGVFQIDGADAIISKGTITIANNVAPVQGSAAVEPADVFPGEQIITVSLTVIPASTVLWRKSLTGTTAGTTAAAVVAVGSCEAKFVLDANNSVDITIANMRFACPYPDADPGGGPAEIVLEGEAYVKADGTTPYTIVVKNTVASY